MEKIAFLFPGQGSQYVGMMKNFYDNYEIARQTFDEASHILSRNLAALCFEGSLFELNKPSNMQPLMLTANIVAYRVFMKEFGVTPQFSAGHSLGEYAALTSAGAIRFADAVRLTHLRGALTERAADSNEGGMSIVDGADEATVMAACAAASDGDRVVSISCANSPSQYAISGHQDAVERAETILLGQNSATTPLFMSAPFHCGLMKEAAAELQEALSHVTFNQFKWPVISNVTGLPYTEAERIVELLTRQLHAPVQWQRTMQYLKSHGVTMTIELGPKNVLSALTGANLEGVTVYAFGQKEDRQALKDALASNSGRPRPTVVTKCMAAAVATPNQNWDNDAYRKGVVEPYKAIQRIQEKLESEGVEPTVEQMKECLALLRTIFQTKMVDEAEQQEWFHQIIDETLTYYLLDNAEVTTA